MLGLQPGDFVLGNLLGDESDQFSLNPPFHLLFGDAEPCCLLTG